MKILRKAVGTVFLVGFGITYGITVLALDSLLTTRITISRQ